MSDAMITPPVMGQARRRTATAEMTAAEIDRIRLEEPHLHAEIRAAVEALAAQVREESGPSEAAETAQAFAVTLAARVYLSLRLGHERLWRKTSGVADPFGPAAALPAALREEVRGLLSKGLKIEAIRKIRQATRLGLKEAKDIVDHVEGELS